MPLDVDALIQILTEPKNALVKQYQKFFEMEGGEARVHPRRPRRDRREAPKRDTGARGLRAVVEEIMLDVMYELPDQGQGGKYVITEDDRRRQTQPLRNQTRNPPQRIRVRRVSRTDHQNADRARSVGFSILH